jgi:hypothetical protein
VHVPASPPRGAGLGGGCIASTRVYGRRRSLPRGAGQTRPSRVRSHVSVGGMLEAMVGHPLLWYCSYIRAILPRHACPSGRGRRPPRAGGLSAGGKLARELLQIVDAWYAIVGPPVAPAVRPCSTKGFGPSSRRCHRPACRTGSRAPASQAMASGTNCSGPGQARVALFDAHGWPWRRKPLV